MAFVGVSDQYCLQISLNGSPDWLNPEDFVFFRVSEEAGNTLPQFMLKFRITDDNSSYVVQFNETAVLLASYGSDPGNLVTSSLYVTETSMIPSGDAWILNVEGTLNAPAYLYARYTGCSPKESGVTCVLNTARKYFQIKSNIGSSEDSQNWVQHNISDKQFVRNCWIHSWIPGSFISVGISAMNNTFVLNDMATSFAGGGGWIFSPDADDSVWNQISYMGNPQIKNISGFINSWLGYPTTLNIYNVDTGEYTTAQTSSNLFQSSTGGQIVNPNLTSPRQGLYLTQTSNMHQMYHQARQNNLVGNAVASSFKVDLMFDKKFRPVMVLDQAVFQLGNVSDAVSEYASGGFTVYKVVRLFGKNTCRTMVGLCREAPGGSVSLIS